MCNDSNIIGERIKTLREAKNLTQAELAENLYVKRETVNQWENGTRDLKTSYTVKLAEFFNISCDYILRGVSADNIEINKRIGLSERAIQKLDFINACGDQENVITTLNYLIENEFTGRDNLQAYNYFYPEYKIKYLDSTLFGLGNLDFISNISKYLFLRKTNKIAYITESGEITNEKPVSSRYADEIKEKIKNDWGDMFTAFELNGSEVVETIVLNKILEILKKLKEQKEVGTDGDNTRT